MVDAVNLAPLAFNQVKAKEIAGIVVTSDLDDVLGEANMTRDEAEAAINTVKARLNLAPFPDTSF